MVRDSRTTGLTREIVSEGIRKIKEAGSEIDFLPLLSLSKERFLEWEEIELKLKDYPNMKPKYKVGDKVYNLIYYNCGFHELNTSIDINKFTIKKIYLFKIHDEMFFKYEIEEYENIYLEEDLGTYGEALKKTEEIVKEVKNYFKKETRERVKIFEDCLEELKAEEKK